MLMYLSVSGQFFHPDHPLTRNKVMGMGGGGRSPSQAPWHKLTVYHPWALGNSSSGLISRKKFIPNLKNWEKERSGDRSCCPTCGVLQQEPTPVLVIVLSRLQQVQIWGEFDSNYSVFDDVVYEKQQNLNYKENEEKQQPERNKSLGFVTIQ